MTQQRDLGRSVRYGWCVLAASGAPLEILTFGFVDLITKRREVNALVYLTLPYLRIDGETVLLYSNFPNFSLGAG